MVAKTKIVKSVAWLAAAAGLGIPLPGYGQLRLVSSTPADGTTSVPTLATFVFVFSAPLDTSARFEQPEDFFLGLEVFPADSLGEPAQIIVSSSLDTVTVKDIPLTPDTRYAVLLEGARSTTGEGLDRPYALTFTTGGALPGGTVSGSITFPGGDPGGTAVGLFGELPFGEDENGPEAVAVVPLAASTFTVKYVPGGSYYVLALNDLNHDGVFDFAEDAFGGYDADSDARADKITLSEGQNLGNIELTITLTAAVTARAHFPPARGIAESEFADAALSFIGSNAAMDDGKSKSWVYGFYSAENDSVFAVTTIGGLDFLFPIPQDGGEGPALNVPLPENWIDSDAAYDSAEAHGGSDFRSMYPDAGVNAVATVFILPGMGGPSVGKFVSLPRKSRWVPGIPGRDEGREALRKNSTAADDTLAAWIFIYSSEAAGQEKMIVLDLVTGAPLELPGPGGPTTAGANLTTAHQMALAWAADAVLVALGNASPDLTPNGFAGAWSFGYYSAAKDSARAFIIVTGIVTGEDPVAKESLPSLEPLPDGWLDSPVVTPIAEAKSNNFRNMYADAVVQALLSRGLLPDDLSRAVWRFTYFSAAGSQKVVIDLDALNGDVITGIAQESTATVPNAYVLEQNYPNPFNPETEIRFGLPESGEVVLSIYNTMGREIRRLVGGRYEAGVYHIRWDGKSDSGDIVPSGVYLYELRTRQTRQMKKMTVIH